MENNTNTTEENATRQSSKFSLDSSPSILSADDQLEGDGPLTPTDKMEDDVEDEDDDEVPIKHAIDDDDDDLSALNSILQAGSPGSLSEEEEEEEENDIDDLHQDSASPLSSIPDDFPLSRSPSPEIPQEEELELENKMKEDYTDNTETKIKKRKKEEEDDEEEEGEEEDKEALTGKTTRRPSESTSINTRKRRKDDNAHKQNGDSVISNEYKKGKKEDNDDDDMIKDTNSLKKSKLIDESISTETKTLNDNINGDSSSHEDTISKSKRRRVSKSTLEVTEITRSRRRQSRQEEKEIILEKKIEEKTEEKQVIKDDSQDKEETKDTSTLSEETIERKEEETNSSEQKESDSVIIKKGEEQIEEGVPENQKNRNQDIQDDVDYDYQQRHKEALDALTHIEIEFARLRDKMYQEKMSELNEEAIMIANGTHPELVALMAEIEEKKGRRIHNAEAWRRHQHANFKQQFEGFEYQANIHFISQKNALRRNLLSDINNKKWTIEDERTKLNDPSRGDKLFPDGHEMVLHKREQKEEIGDLQDIKEVIGFPMAPNPTGLNSQDIDDDLKLLGINNNRHLL